MNKSKEFFQTQINKFDDEYWNYFDKINNTTKELKNLQYTLETYTSFAENAKRERDFYQDLLDDFMINEVNG